MTWSRRGLLGGMGAIALTGCEGMVFEPPAPPPEPPTLSTSNEAHYAARRDGSHTLPAVPLDAFPDWLLRQIVRYPTPGLDAPEAEPGEIVILSRFALLHLVLPDGFALRYGISIGREGLDWTGSAEVYRTARWPSWTPTPSMIERDPSLERWAEGQPGGPANPLGARALYLRTLATGRDEGIRIHGTPEWRSIGRRASSGCFRMWQQDVIDLYGRAGRGARVTVV